MEVKMKVLKSQYNELKVMYKAIKDGKGERIKLKVKTDDPDKVKIIEFS